MKSVGIAYLCWFFSVHRFYLGRPGSALLYIFSCGGFGIWAIIDLILIPTMVEEENRAFADLFGRGDVTVNVDSSPGRRRKSRRRDDDYDD